MFIGYLKNIVAIMLSLVEIYSVLIKINTLLCKCFFIKVIIKCLQFVENLKVPSTGVYSDIKKHINLSAYFHLCRCVVFVTVWDLTYYLYL